MFAKVCIWLFVAVAVAVIAVANAQILDKKYGIEFGTINYPSGPFEKTINSSPPVDLNQGVVFLPEATPIHEQPQESKIKEMVQAQSTASTSSTRKTTTPHPKVPRKYQKLAVRY